MSEKNYVEDGGGECRPDFIELLDNFRVEVMKMSENASIISQKVNMIKMLEETPVVDDGSEKISTGLISEFWYCVNKMTAYNDSLYKSRSALGRLIG